MSVSDDKPMLVSCAFLAPGDDTPMLVSWEFRSISLVSAALGRSLGVNNIAAARAVEREFNYNFGSDLGLFGSGSGSNGRGAPVGFIWTDFQLKRSHGDPFRDHNRAFVQAVPTRELQELGNLPSDFQDCFRTTQRVLGLTSLWFLLRTEPSQPVS